MKRKSLIISVATLILLFFLALVTLAQENEPVPEPDNAQQAAPRAILADMGTAFTYQGSLVDDSNPANGIYDFQFSLFNAVTVGSQIGVTQAVDDIGVSEGLFTVSLDFGTDAFNGQARWLEIAVKHDADGSYTSLTPRVTLTPAPNALALPGLWTQQTGNGNPPNLIGGYAGNVMGNGVVGGVIAGGGSSLFNNRIYGSYGTIGGGRGNIVGIDSNNANEFYAVNESYATVGGGVANIASGFSATVGGGFSNSASGSYATVGGGEVNTAAGDYSFAAGRRAKANHDGAFVWADNTNADFNSTAANTFNVQAGGGVNLVVQSSGLTPSGVLIDQQSNNGVGLFISQTSSDAALVVTNEGTGDLIKSFATAGGGNLRFRVTNSGEVYADGQFNANGADFAEMLPGVSGLEAGDVLAIGPDGQLIRTTEAYQPTVVGVYSTQPGFVGGMPIEDATEGKVPLAVVGVVPVKASAEGGAIQPGDMLTASATPGHAMKAKPDAPQGTVIGKALEPLSDDTGMILMLVILQ